MRPVRALHSLWRPSNDADERRSAPRREAQLDARLLFSVSVLDVNENSRSKQHLLTLAGYTHNISETGLAITVPSIHVGGQYLNVVGNKLRILLDLPTGPVQIYGTPVRCERLDKEGREGGYLVGVRITQMSDSEWVRLVKYLYTLR